MRRWRWPFGNPRPAARSSRIPILTCHAAHAHGYDYASDDHRALEADLALIRRTGFKVVPLAEVVAYVLGEDDAEPCDATHGINRWHIPRFVCGQHLRSPDELERILVDAHGTDRCRS